MIDENGLIFYNMLAGSMILTYAMLFWRPGKHMRQSDIDVLADDFTNLVEDMVADGKIKREIATEVYVRLKRVFPTRELYPTPSWLKDSIKRRLTLHIHDPVVLPDPAPVRKKKHMFDRA